MSRQHDDSRALAAFAPALLLIAAAFLINYIDRGNISVAGNLIRKEFRLSDSQLGILFAAFFATYTLMQFVIGWLVDRIDANRILAAGFLLWSVATATTGLVRGFALLLAMRFILGIIIGCALTIGGAYIVDRISVAAAKPVMVNWDVVAKNFDSATTRAREGWKKIAGAPFSSPAAASRRHSCIVGISSM